MTPFRQLILPGDLGSDVLAVKRALRSMEITGAGTMVLSKRAGTAFVDVLERAQRQHRLPADGKYGKATHAVVAPFFDAWGTVLYRRAQIRDRTPPLLTAPAATVAQELLKLRAAGKYRADNPGDLADIERTAAGQAVWSRGGYWVHLDPRPLRLLVWLIGRGHKLGTFALCSDHHWDGPHGHSGGLAVDISSIDGRSVGASGSHTVTLAVAREIRNVTPAGLRPAQLICAGSGGAYYSDIEALCIPSPGFYGWGTLSGHLNHIHAGYF